MLGDRGRGPVDRRALRAHAALRRGHRLEEVILRHALGLPLDGLAREPAASRRDDAADPARRRARTRSTARTRRARSPASSGSRSRSRRAAAVAPLPDGDRYLGFLFARGDTPGGGRGRAARGARRARRSIMARSREASLLVVDLRARPPAARGRRARPASCAPAATTCARSTSRSTRGIPTLGDVGRPGRVLGADAHRDRALAREVATDASTVPVCVLRALRGDVRRRRRRALVGRDPDAALVALGRRRRPDVARAATPRCPPATCSRRSTGTRASSSRRRGAPRRRRSRRQPRLRAPVPALPGAGRLRRPDPHRRRRRGARRHRPAGRRRAPRHITFGDPDFLNGVAPLAARRARGARALPRRSRSTARSRSSTSCATPTSGPSSRTPGCLFVVSAFESVNDDDPRAPRQGPHRGRRRRAPSRCCAAHGIEIRPSFLPFTPWTTLDDVGRCSSSSPTTISSATSTRCSTRSGCSLPTGSLLLDHPDLAPHVGPWDADAVARYHVAVARPRASTRSSSESPRVESSRRDGDADPRDLRRGRAPRPARRRRAAPRRPRRPRLTEPWFCCAEPTALQLALDSRPITRGVGIRLDRRA